MPGEYAKALRVAAGRKVERRLVPVDRGRPLLQVRLSPPRASLEKEVEVRMEALSPAQGVEVYLEGERLLALEAVGGGLLALPFGVRAWQGGSGRCGEGSPPPFALRAYSPLNRFIWPYAENGENPSS